MNGVEGYITIEVSQRGGRMIAVLRTLESSDSEALENREEEEFILELSPRINLYPSSTPLTIPLPYPSCQTAEEALTKTQFLSSLLYQIQIGRAHV